MEFDLNRNASNFINESLHCARRASKESDKYPIAIVLLIQGLELTLKFLLSKENEMLVYDNVDNPNINKTVGISAALNRLVSFKVIDLEPSDKLRLEKTIKIRNQITHFQFNLNPKQAHSYYLRLFEFIHYFYSKYLSKDLHDIIQKEYWAFEAELLSEIKKSEYVHYHGITVHKNHPKDIIESQQYDGLEIDNEIFDRIPFGSETTFKIGNSDLCGDCGVIKGFYHTDNCDHEQCPKCGEQLIGFHKCEHTAYVTIEK
ncbi:hypothetical protein CJ739_1895 [Mariniflexile rhizosphaerae]|uniref:hypothetical protein n=1 Tax=unclassified Mariniflexile TaxID=2643887 RepID=UPI000CAC4402|nr:hypothetical protein [Mariniflexile sp. TRM1-10]AXP80980.1 hypothetical protein CJ739_1895 [Mariniflexile sp. TRM1-10]PLB19941.1 MAG: hypothetical protein TRG1_1205 [Flavobacteriaceae bacterium FS1-H7996/R]